jgi:hypothetical protein
MGMPPSVLDSGCPGLVEVVARSAAQIAPRDGPSASGENPTGGSRAEALSGLSRAATIVP